MNRPQRRAVTLAGLAVDLLAFLALSGGVLAGAIPAGHMIIPAVTLAAGITCGTAYLYWSRPRVSLPPPRPQVNRCPYDSCHHNHEEGSRS